MGFRNGSYAKVWEVAVAPSGKSTRIKFSISKKDRSTGEYSTEFSGFASLLGEAHKKAGILQSGDRIKLEECDVSSHYDKEKNQTFYQFKVWKFSKADAPQQTTADYPFEGGTEPIPEKSETSQTPQSLPF
ncbi:MAG: hypothetical protein NC084_04145 [Bacteroides sp.]|nr:hypothetical protein [Eubacterium sp.]MCM1417643.1 hypothetical protein [Roseburia sp.]MCM1461892.1 hypothetical protein [Bacteroides sp.]